MYEYATIGNWTGTDEKPPDQLTIDPTIRVFGFKTEQEAKDWLATTISYWYTNAVIVPVELLKIQEPIDKS